MRRAKIVFKTLAQTAVNTRGSAKFKSEIRVRIRVWIRAEVRRATRARAPKFLRTNRSSRQRYVLKGEIRSTHNNHADCAGWGTATGTATGTVTGTAISQQQSGRRLRDVTKAGIRVCAWTYWIRRSLIHLNFPRFNFPRLNFSLAFVSR